MITWIIGAVVALAFGAAAYFTFGKRGGGCSSCQGCANSAHCHKK